jgi:hypothetical protein
MAFWVKAPSSRFRKALIVSVSDQIDSFGVLIAIHLAGLFVRRTAANSAFDAWLYRAKPLQGTLGKAALFVVCVSDFFALYYAKVSKCILNRAAFVAMKTRHGRKYFKASCDFATGIPNTTVDQSVL